MAFHWLRKAILSARWNVLDEQASSILAGLRIGPPGIVVLMGSIPGKNVTIIY